MRHWKESLALRNRIASAWLSPTYVSNWRYTVCEGFRHPVGVGEFPEYVYSPTTPVEEASYLLRSPVYHVAEDVIDLGRAVSPKWQDEPLLASDFPSPAGFMTFDRNLLFRVRVGEERMRWGIEAVTWWPAEFGFDDDPDPDDELEWNWAEHTTDADEPAQGVSLAVYVADLAEPLLFDQGYVRFDSFDHVNLLTPPLNTVARDLQIILRLLANEVLIATTRAPAAKKTRRASKLQPVLVFSLPRRNPSVQVAPDGKRTVNWSHRWWVNGHWRNQWHPSLNAHRQRWIHGYVKGPEELDFYTPPDRAFRS